MTKVVIPLEHSSTLADCGYRLVEPKATVRHTALCKAMKAYGGGYVVRKLNVLAIYRKNAKRGTRTWVHGRRAENDKRWLRDVRRRLSPEARAEDVQRYRDYRAGKRVKKSQN